MLEATLATGAFDRNFVVLSLEGVERLGEPFQFDVEFFTDAPLDGGDQDALFDAPIGVTIREDGELRRVISGMVGSVEQLGTLDANQFCYRLRILPRMSALALTTAVDVHLDVSVVDLIKSKLELAGLAPEDYDIRLGADYPAREFVVQYKETTLAFVQRLCEYWGITMLFEEHDGADFAVFTDNASGYPDLFEGPSSVPLVGVFDGRNIHALRTKRSPIPKRFVVRDYNYRLPQLDLFATETAAGPGFGGDMIEYGTHFKTPEEGSFFARIHSEQARVGYIKHEAESGLMELRAGSKLTIREVAGGDLDVLVTEVRHSVSRQQAAGSLAYKNQFVAVDAKLPYRPARNTPIPKVHGVLTGRVETPSKGDYAEIDEEGRYKIRFLFDSTERGDAQASRPVRMMQPHSGPGYGMHFPLRAGVEVALTFVDGDPDRPVIVGTVPNPQTQSPVTSDNATKNVIRTGGGNEIDIDDKKGSHRIKLSTPHLNTIFQLGAPNAPEDGAVLTTYGNSSTVATTSIGAITTMGTTYTLAKKLSAAGDIVSYASKPGFAEKALVALSLVDSVASIGAAALDITKQVLTTKDGAKQGTMIVEDNKTKKKQSAVTGNDTALSNGLDGAGLTSSPAYELPQTDAAMATYVAALSSKSKKEQAQFSIAFYQKRRADLDKAYADLSSAQDAYNDSIRQKRDGSLSVDGAITAKHAALVAAWKAVVALEEELDGDETSPSGGISPAIHTEASRDVAMEGSTTGTMYTKANLFTGSASPDTVKQMRDAIDAYEATLGTSAADETKKKGVAALEKTITAQHGDPTKTERGAMGALQSQMVTSADAKRDAGDSAYWLASSETCKNIAKAQVGFNTLRTGTALISVIANLFNLAVSMREQEKTYASFEGVGIGLDKLNSAVFPQPKLDFTRLLIEGPQGRPAVPGLFKPNSSTVNLVGSEEVLGLYGERLMFGWAPFMTLAAETLVLAAGTNIGFEESAGLNPAKKQIKAKDADAHAAIVLSERAVEVRAKDNLAQSSKRILVRSSTLVSPFSHSTYAATGAPVVTPPTDPVPPPAAGAGEMQAGAWDAAKFTELELNGDTRITSRVSAAGKDTSYLELGSSKIAAAAKTEVRLAIETQPKAGMDDTACAPQAKPKSEIILGVDKMTLSVGEKVKLEAKADKDVTLSNTDITVKLGKDGTLTLDAKTKIVLKVGAVNLTMTKDGITLTNGAGKVEVKNNTVKLTGGGGTLDVGPADVKSKPMVKAG